MEHPIGKRSSFDRVPKDLYETIDPRAVAPLLPFLPQKTRYCEPCAGNLALVRQLDKAGHVCYLASDIERRNSEVVISGSTVGFTAIVEDALNLTIPLQRADCIITNPPWSRHILHPMIEHFRKHNKSWLLIDAAWAFTKQSSDYMKYCSKFIAVGRVIWIPGTKVSGKDDAAWYCFEQEPCDTQFIGR